jgi:DNA polymerase-3 subunit epsilon
MRQIVLDTETTGLEPEQGHRIIELGCVELVDRRATGHNFHQYLQPDREIDARAEEVHGISNAFLADKPRFPDVLPDLLAYVKGSELIIHNAPFDVGFLNSELARAGTDWGRIEDYCGITDTLEMARRLHPGQRNSLDALCARYRIDHTRRDKHGALLDAEILADVYLAMTGGQVALSLDGASAAERGPGSASTVRRWVRREARLAVVKASPDELAAHRRRMADIDRASGGKCIWAVMDEAP